MVMESKIMYGLAVWFACVLCLTVGFPHGGRLVPVNKRSDFSMYDNQFFRVGDTALDNEVTDCALVRHQYARGFIRLREFLERMQGCGIKGKMNNIAGIEAATKDAVDFPDDSPAPQQTVAKAASFKPRPISEVLDNKNQQKPHIAAYHSQGLTNNQAAARQGIQSNPNFNNFGFFTQESGPLSYSPNPAPVSPQAPFVRKLISRKNMDIPQTQALKNLSGVKNRKWPDPQRYYSEQTAALTQPNLAPAFTGGQPITRPNPFPLAFHQQVQVTSPSHPLAFQPSNPDVDIIKNTQKPVKQASQVQAGKIRDDINGDEAENDVQDEANEATIDSQESDPLPSETSFTYNPNLEEEETPKDADAIAEAQNTAVNGLPNHPNTPLPMNSVPGESPHSNHYLPADGPSTAMNKPDQNKPVAGKTVLQTGQQNQQDKKLVVSPQTTPVTTSQNSPNTPGVQKTQNSPTTQKTPAKLSTPNVPTTPKAVNPALPINPSGQVKGDDLNGGSDGSKLDEFLKPESGNDDKQDQQDAEDKTADQQTPATQEQQPASPELNKKPGNLAINLDVLKNRISSSKDVGFLKRMLSLIRKITHHKDFRKLGGVQRNAIMQAGMAVHNAVSSKSDDISQRSSIQPQPMNWSPGQYTAQGYYNPQYGVSAAVQRSFIQQNPPNWKPGDYTYNGYNAYASSPRVNYAYPSYQASAHYSPPHWSPGDYTTGSSTAQLVKPKPQTQKSTKKFQIERNQYTEAKTQAQRPVASSYRPPYSSLGSLSFGLYNGNTP